MLNSQHCTFIDCSIREFCITNTDYHTEVTKDTMWIILLNPHWSVVEDIKCNIQRIFHYHKLSKPIATLFHLPTHTLTSVYKVSSSVSLISWQLFSVDCMIPCGVTLSPSSSSSLSVLLVTPQWSQYCNLLQILLGILNSVQLHLWAWLVQQQM